MHEFACNTAGKHAGCSIYDHHHPLEQRHHSAVPVCLWEGGLSALAEVGRRAPLSRIHGRTQHDLG